MVVLQIYIDHLGVPTIYNDRFLSGIRACLFVAHATVCQHTCQLQAYKIPLYILLATDFNNPC